MAVPAPFYNAIKGTTAGTPGTTAFTPNAASTGFRAWSLVPTGWIGLVRYEDGASWELSYSYWNGTTLSRASTQLFDSSSGSAISLTSAATAAMVADAGDVQPDFCSTKTIWWSAVVNAATTTQVIGTAAPTTQGTAAGTAIAATNYLTEQLRTQFTSATTANAQAGLNWSNVMVAVSTSAGRGGFEFACRFGASALPTGPRLFVGMTSATFAANTGEPSALVAAVAAFAVDSTDTNIQLLTNAAASGAGTKIDTGIPLAANGWYEARIWCEPGSNKVYALLIRLDTGAIWLGSTTTDVPATGALLEPNVLCGLNGTNTGTAAVFHIGAVAIRVGQ